MKKYIIIAFTVLAFMSCGKKETYKFPFLNPELSVDERAEDMVSRMTLQEKIDQLNYQAKAIDSLGVPRYNWWNECLHGVARAGIATVYPQAIGLAATWDKDLMFKVASAISDEGRAKYHDFISKDKRGIYQGITFWTPNINIFRDPRWGRGMETYGECPYLTGTLAVNFIKALQGDDTKYIKCIATAKHYAVHSGPEWNRHIFNAKTSDYDLRETYLPAFEMCVKDANVQSVMCAYNRFRDKPCCGNDSLLNHILRNEWGFNGYVVSDCWALNDFFHTDKHHVVETAPEAAAMAFSNGTDINCGNTSPHLKEAVEKGFITEDAINLAVKRLMKARILMGMFDPQEKVPYSSIPYDVVDNEDHKQLALEAARKSIVLLKNENNALPLSKDIKKIAVLGPNANDLEVLLANYNGIPSAPVTPLDGIRQKLPNAQVTFAMGCEHADNLPTFEAVPASALFTDNTLKESGLKAEYFDNQTWSGSPKHTRVDADVNFYWWDKAPFEDLDADDFSIRWTGYIVPPVSGKYAIGGQGFYGWTMNIIDKDTIARLKYKNEHHSLKEYEFVYLQKGKPYQVEIKYWENHGDAEMRMIWAVPGKNYEAEAVKAVLESDVVIMFMGLSPRLEGEEMKVHVDGFQGGDRIRIDLPDLQQRFIKRIYALGKPVVLVMLNGSAVSINWEQANIPAIVEAWYPGQAAGQAIADVLFGDYNPAGRLPVTFYKSVKDIPDFEDYNMEGRTYRYFKGEPLYAFGYGLSYTTFEYKNLVVDKSKIKQDDIVNVTVDVTNNGKLAGDEVVQLYIQDVESTEPRSIKDLCGYERISLGAGETKKVSFKISKKELANWSESKGAYYTEPGLYKVLVGKSSRPEDLISVDLEVIE